MLKKCYKRLIIISFFFITLTVQQLQAQGLPGQPKAPGAALPLREVSGFVKDTTDTGIPNATIKLVSNQDTLSTHTNEDGVFKFLNIKSSSYTLSISSIGYKTFVGRYKQSDAVNRIVMDPITLEPETNMLNEVMVNGKPRIVYKVDTVEYTASNYIVREHATIDELLKKMEGMDVSSKGTLYHEGKEVTKAKINGKTYLDGDISTTIKNLPAEIVEKIQIVNDYGDQAARTGIKDGDPKKVLNIVTKVEKSVGNSANIKGGVGNNERYDGAIFATRLNGDRNIGFNTKIENTVNGVNNTTGDNNIGLIGIGFGNSLNNSGLNTTKGSGGMSNTGSTIFSFNDKFNKNTNINTNYSYNFNNTNNTNSSVAKIFSSFGTTLTANESSDAYINKTHNLSIEVETDLDKYNFLRVKPTLNFSANSGNNQATILQQGLIHQGQNINNINSNKRPTLGADIFYQHYFMKPRRNFSIQISFNNANLKEKEEANSNIIYYQNNSDIILKDSVVNFLIDRKKVTSNYRGSMTYVEPLSTNTQLEFNTQVNYNGYDNNATTSNLFSNGNSLIVDSLSNIYNYSFTQARLAINYRYGIAASKFSFSLGLTAIPSVLNGTMVSSSTTTHRNNFNLIPITRLQYAWSSSHSIQLNYYGNPNEPTFNQIQPIRDVSNPQNPVIGNPNLKVAFNHSINSNYSNYIANKQLGYTVNLNATFVESAIIRNTVQITDSYNSLKNETRFENINGVYRFGGNYNINKQLNSWRYVLAYSGNISNNHLVSLSNNFKNVTSTWYFGQKFGPKINPTDWLEINPSMTYSITKSNNTLPTSIVSKNKILALNIEGKLILWESWIFGYNASKNYLSGINANISNNPFVINSYLQKRLWRNKAVLSLEAFDILNQNNFINRSFTEQSIIDTKSNILSRYLIMRFTVNLQKWTSYKEKSGKPITRRGDGGFN